MEDGSWMSYLTDGLEFEMEDRSRQVYELLGALTISNHSRLDDEDRKTEANGLLGAEYEAAVSDYESLADEKAASVFEKVTSASRGFKLAGEIYAKAAELAKDWPYPKTNIDGIVKELEVLSTAYTTLQSVIETAIKKNGLDPDFYMDKTAEYYGLMDVRFRIQRAIDHCDNFSIREELEELRDTNIRASLYSKL